MSSDPFVRLEELQNELKTRQVALQERVGYALCEAGGHELPSLEDLNDERGQLMEDIEKIRNAGIAIMKELEMNEELFKVFCSAARVQRFENFANFARNYVRKDLPNEIHAIIEADKRRAKLEASSNIKKLKAQRDLEVKRIAALKERIASYSNAMRNTTWVDSDTPNARCRSAAKKGELEKEEQQVVGFTEEQRCDNAEMHSKVKQLRQECSKLKVDIVDEKHRNSKRITELKTHIRQTDLKNKSDMRRCTELNTGNATLTTSSQILMSLLNGEHYALKGTPSMKEVIRLLKEALLRAAMESERKRNGIHDGESDLLSALNSRRSSLLNELLIDEKTLSQRNREEEEEAARRMYGDSPFVTAMRRKR